MKTTNDFNHRRDNPFGENLYMKTFTVDTPGALDSLKCEDGIKFWYDEIQDFDFSKGRPFQKSLDEGKKVGHFTQLVWDDTRYVGCAKSYSEKSFTVYIVCNYDPPGNIKRGYKKHVIPPK